MERGFSLFQLFTIPGLSLDFYFLHQIKGQIFCLLVAISQRMTTQFANEEPWSVRQVMINFLGSMFYTNEFALSRFLLAHQICSILSHQFTSKQTSITAPTIVFTLNLTRFSSWNIFSTMPSLIKMRTAAERCVVEKENFTLEYCLIRNVG